MSAEGKQIRGGEGRRSRNSSGAVEGGEVGAAAVRRRTAWLNWLGYGRLGLGFTSRPGGALGLGLGWRTTRGYGLRRDGGGRRLMGGMGWRTEDAGVSRLVER